MGFVVFFLVSCGLIVVLWGIGKRNGFVASANLVAESWRQIDVELRRRYDLIPALVQVVEAHARYERATLEALAAARAFAMGTQQLPQRALAEDGLDQNVRNVLIQAEAYPTLRSNRQFMALQRELAGTEDRIAAGRRLYNGNVRSFNTALASFPGSVVGSMMGLQPAAYFEPDAR